MNKSARKKIRETDKLSNYTFLKTIGKGTFGKVKLGIHKPTGEQVAIKILEKSKIQNKRDLERIEKEIKYLKLFNHPNIVKIYEIIEDDTNFYIIMEYVSGGELFTYIVNQQKLDEKEASFFYSQIIHIIQEIHQKNICHRDIKPENLLLTSNKTLKIIDFGLSNEYKDLLDTPCGSPCYASPEIIRGNKYSGVAIDLWASGIILFSMLCGYLPFDDKDNDILFYKILECKVIFPKNNECNLSNEAKDLIKKILIPNPAKRITLDEILNHPFLIYGNKRYKEKVNTGIFKQDELIINYMINEMKIPNENDIIRKCIANNKHNSYTTTFNLLKKKYIEGRLNYSYSKNPTPVNFNTINNDRRTRDFYTNRLVKKNMLNGRYKEIEDKKTINEKNNPQNNISLAKDIGNIIKKKVSENNNNIIIINNTDSSIHQPIKMNSLIYSIINENRTTRKTETNNSVNNRNRIRKLNKIIDTSISFEKRSNERFNAFNASRNKDNNSKNRMQSQSPTNAIRFSALIKGKHARPKKYLNSSYNNNDSFIYSTNTMNFPNNVTTNVNCLTIDAMSNDLGKQKRINTDLIDVNYCENKNDSNDYKKKENSKLYVKNLVRLASSKKELKHTVENSREKDIKGMTTKNFYKHRQLLNSIDMSTKENNGNSIRSINVIIDESTNKMTNNNIKDSNLYRFLEGCTNTKPTRKYHFKLRDIQFNTNNNSMNPNLENNYINTSPNLKGSDDLEKFSRNRVKSNDNDNNDTERTKTKTGKTKGLSSLLDECLNYNSNEHLNVTERGNVNKTVVNENQYSNKKVRAYERTAIKPYSRKLLSSNKKMKTEYLLVSVNMTSYKIFILINKFCKKEGFNFIKDNFKYTIFLDDERENSFKVEIRLKEKNNNYEIKMIHNTGNESITHECMKNLLFTIMK